MACAPSKRPASFRYFSESGLDLCHHDHQHGPTDQKRLRPATRFAFVVEKVRQLNQLEKFWSALAPILRQVVSEEVKRALDNAITARRHLGRPPSLQILVPAPAPAIMSPLHLVFARTLKFPIFTLNRIVSDDNSPVQVLLADATVDPATTIAVLPTAFPFPIKLEVVVLKGDFPPLCRDGDGVWTEEEFEDSILKPREGRRPLLAGDHLTATLRQLDGGGKELMAASFADFLLTDNSSWVRSRKFRLGVRVIPGSCGTAVRICEAVSEPFVVRDHRGESYKKHYPPKLEDEVWRLEKIRHGGILYMNLASAGVKTVQDFLRMCIVDPGRLRSILGSEKNWMVSVKHAMTCEMGSKLYVFHEADAYLVLDPICRVVTANMGGQIYTRAELVNLGFKEQNDQLVKAAYSRWDRLQEIEANEMISGP